MVQREEAYVRPWNFANVEKFIIPSSDDAISRIFSLLLYREKTSCESREWRRDFVILPLVHPPAFDRDFFWDRRYDILDRFDELGRFFVKEMEICNQLGIIRRERFRGHGRWCARKSGLRNLGMVFGRRCAP